MQQYKSDYLKLDVCILDERAGKTFFEYNNLHFSNNKYSKNHKQMYDKFQFKNQINCMYFFGLISMDNG